MDDIDDRCHRQDDDEISSYGRDDIRWTTFSSSS